MYAKHHNGFTLIEILVSLVIVSFVMSGVLMVFQSQSTLAVTSEDDSYIQSSIQSATHILRNRVVMAGFAPGNNSYVFTNSSGTNAGPDSLTVNTTALDGSVIMKPHVTLAGVVSGNVFNFYCTGLDNTAGRADENFDVLKSTVPGMNTYLLFEDITNNTMLTGLGANPVRVVADSGPNCIPHPMGIDNNADGNPDPVVTITTESNLMNVPRSAFVYAFHATSPTANPQSRIWLNTATSMLMLDNVPLLWGVEDFQVQFETNGGGWTDALPANQTQITQVAVGLVMRFPRMHKTGPASLEALEARGRYQITTFDHTFDFTPGNPDLTIECATATPPAACCEHKQQIFFVRPRNVF